MGCVGTENKNSQYTDRRFTTMPARERVYLDAAILENATGHRRVALGPGANDCHWGPRDRTS
eukprot:11165134-Lingulodinium_polyedra.AAC.1